MPNWIINRNGNEANDIKNDYQEMHQAAMALHAAMQKVYTNSLHGRNYQVNENPDADQDKDRTVVHDMLQEVAEIGEYAMKGAARAIRQREGL